MSLFSIPGPEFSLAAAAALSNHTMALASTSFLYDLVVCQLQLRLLLHFSLACALFFFVFPDHVPWLLAHLSELPAPGIWSNPPLVDFASAFCT